MKKHYLVHLIAVFLLITANEIYSQNTLYLVDTLTGPSTKNKLISARGIGDFNGDGYADFIVCYTNYTDLFFGNPDFTIKPIYRFNTGSAYGIGDVNGDDYADLLILRTDTLYNPAYPYAEIFFGGKELDTIPRFKYYPPYNWNMILSSKVYPLGDLNGDGYNDFAISSPYNWGDGLGRVYIFKGGNNIAETPWTTLKTTLGTGTHFFGSSVLGIGDYNNDGNGDFLVTDPTLSADSDKVYLYWGNKDRIDAVSNKIFGPFKRFVETQAAGDLNGDGQRDFIISANDTVKIYTGNISPIIYDATNEERGGEVSIGTGGDINDDGFDDFLIGNDAYRKDSVYLGRLDCFWGKTYLDMHYSFSIEGDQEYSSFAKSISISGDINGDRYKDVFVLAPSFRNYDEIDSTVGKLYIYSYVKITGINNKDINTSTSFKLNQNYPNPFNPSTTISYQLSRASFVTLMVFNLLGQKVTTLVNGVIHPTGKYKMKFNPEKYSLSSGVYFLKLEVINAYSSIKENHKEVIKMVYLK